MRVTILSVMTTVTAPARRRTTALVVALLALLAVALVAIAVLVVRGRGDDTPTPTVAPQVIAAVDNVDYFVGTNLEVGAYRQSVATPACYYRISDPITDELIEESLKGAKGPLTVNLGKDVKFRSTGCGAWTPAG